MKICNRCDIEKEEIEFGRRKLNKDGLQNTCKTCTKILRVGYNKTYSEKNKEKIKERSSRYLLEHREERLETTRKYNDSHKEEKQQYQIDNKVIIAKKKKIYSSTHKKERNEYHKKRFESDPSYKMSCSLRSRVRKVFYGKRKPAKTQELIGCTWEEFKIYMEKQFKPGMSWKNHGLHGWHVDHIIPIASFDLSDPEQARAAFHFTNCQPLWAEENMKKSDRLDFVCIS